MSEWRDKRDDSRLRWEQIASYWDAFMGDEGNRFHRELVRPAIEELLDVKRGESILDVGCGNGNFARRLCGLGARIVAFDFSEQMIEFARARSQEYDIDYRVIDATDFNSLTDLGQGMFNGAVAGMALMDMAEIRPLALALQYLLKPQGRVVISLCHPCFCGPDMVKVTEEKEVSGKIVARHAVKVSRYGAECHEGIALSEQPVPHLYFHRPLSVIMNAFFAAGFVLSGIREPVFSGDDSRIWSKLPPALILRFQIS